MERTGPRSATAAATAPGASKALLYIHGAGGSANIFRVQTAKLRLALRNEFEFVYATAPFESKAGPGVLPLFQGMGPYYSWFDKDDDDDDHQGGRQLLLIDVPTVHLHGLLDFALQGSRELAAAHFSPQNASIQEFHSGHHVPSKKSDVDEAARRFLSMYCED